MSKGDTQETKQNIVIATGSATVNAMPNLTG